MTTVDLRKMREERSDAELEDALSARDFHRALTLAKARLEERRARHGDAHAEVANALADLAHALAASGDLVSAAEASLSALALEEQLHGPEDVRVGEALHRLASLQLEARNSADALVLFERAVEVLGRDPRAALACSGLAAARTQSGDLAGAVSALEQALQICALSGGPENAEMLVPLEALAQVREAQGELQDALALRDRLARIAKRARAEDVSRHLLAAARLCLALGKGARAREASEQALIAEPAHNARRAEAHALLGEIFERGQEFLRAREQYRAALETYRVALPARHPQVAVALMNVATLEVALGESERAEPLAREALSLFLDTFGPAHPHTLQMREGLRQAFLDSGATRIAADLASLGASQ